MVLTSDGSSMKLYKDCELKGRILRFILQRGSATSREIYNHVQHRSYHTCISQIYSMKRNGYLSVTNRSKPYNYTLTRKGHLHARDAFIGVKKRQQNMRQRISAILSNDARFRQIIDYEVLQKLVRMSFPSSHFPPFFSLDPYQQAAYVLDELNFRDGEILRLRNQLQQISKLKTSQCQPRPPSIPQEHQPMKSRRGPPRIRPAEK